MACSLSNASGAFPARNRLPLSGQYDSSRTGPVWGCGTSSIDYRQYVCGEQTYGRHCAGPFPLATG